MPGLVILGVIIVVLLVIPIGMYHSPVSKRNQVHNIFGTMGLKLKTLF